MKTLQKNTAIKYKLQGAEGNATLGKYDFSHALRRIVKDRWLYLMLLPGLAFYIIFRFGPVFGLSIVFYDYLPPLGIAGSEFVGFGNILRLFRDPDFPRLFANTLTLAILNITLYFPIPIVLSILLNEVYNTTYKRFIQSFVYLPHFLSWTVLVGIFYIFLSPKGIINELFTTMGLANINFLAEPSWFRPLVIIEIIWKEAGWGTIIYLAALAGVDEQLYEAAVIDGANRFQRIWHITLPSIRSTILILFILRLGSFMDTGFEQIYLMMNSMNRKVADVFDTYVYIEGILNGSFSYSTAVGLFKSLVSLALVLGANKLSKMIGEDGVY